MSVIGGFLIMTGAGLLGTMSLFSIPVTSELGFSQASFAVYVTCMSLFGVATQPLIGMALVRFKKHIRLIAVFGALWGFMSYFWLSQCSRLFEFYIGGVLLSVIIPIVTTLLGVDVVTHWFDKHRSTAIAIVIMGISGGTVLYSQVVQRVIHSMGWRAGYISMGILVAAMSLLGALLISPPPEYYGMKPYGHDASRTSENEKQHEGVDLKQALKMPGFWMFSFATLFGSVYIMGVQQSLAPAFQVDYDFTPTQAATVLSVFSMVCGLSKPVVGMIYEKVGIKKTMLLISGLVIGAMLIIVLSRNTVLGVAAAILFGMGNMFGTLILATFVADAFGRRSYGAVLGYVNMFFTMGLGIGPIIAGRSFDLFGSYRAAYVVFIACCVVCALLTYLADKNIRKAKACLR